MPANLEQTLSIGATFTAEPVNEILGFWFDRLNLNFRIKHAPYNQVFQTLLDSVSVFTGNERGANAVLFRWQDLGNATQLSANAPALLETISCSAATMRVPLIAVSCPCSEEFLREPEQAALAARFDAELAAIADSASNLHFLSADKVLAAYPVMHVNDPLGERIGQIPFTADFFVALGTCLIRKLVSFLRPPFKVAVLDLDNTLWKGVVGEDGWAQVHLEPGHLEFQRLLLNLRQDGLLLAICSKNNESDAWEVFEWRPEMLLRREHFSAWQINWEPKSANLRKIAQELSLGADSFIFFDDDSKECEEVRASAPEVLALQVPKAPENLPSFLRHVWALDRSKVTGEDRKRNVGYLHERDRAEFAKQSTSLQDFMAALDLKVTIEPLRSEMIARVAQLTQRTNQFNTTTIRRTEADLREVLDSGWLQCITASVSDRFGDYGNVGAVLYSVDSGAVVVDSFMLSCRALGRGVEHAILRYLGDLAQRQGLSEVEIRFVASPKNAPALRFLDSLRSTGESGGLFTRSFRIESEYASQLSYNPPASDNAAPLSTEKISHSAPSPVFIDDQEIAVRFNRVEAIREELRKNKATVASPIFSHGTHPGTEVEAKLASIWADTLHLPSVGIHDDFFALGGDSLQAVDLLVRIVEAFDVPDLTLSVLLEAPTIAALAAVLGKQRQMRCLVPLRENGTRPPFFCVPGVGGNVLGFRKLAANLPQDLPFWGLQAPGLDGSKTIDDARQVAALYLNEIRSVQPHGPYFLGGGCLGGIFAFEMAQQLIAQGEQVAFLALMDCYNPAFGKMISRPRYAYCHARFFAKRVIGVARRVAASPKKELPSRLKLVLRGSSSLPMNSQGTTSPRRRIAASDRATSNLQRVHDANLRAGERYVPAPYPGKITIFRAADPIKEPYQDEFLGWRIVARGGIVVEVIPGHHAAFDRRVHGEILDRHLREAQQEPRRYTA